MTRRRPQPVTRQYAATVVDVHDGDTLTVRVVNRNSQKVRSAITSAPTPMQLHLVSSDPTEAELRALFVALTGREPTAEELAEAQTDTGTEPEEEA